jgi:hypothetical protein
MQAYIGLLSLISTPQTDSPCILQVLSLLDYPDLMTGPGSAGTNIFLFDPAGICTFLEFTNPCCTMRSASLGFIVC